MVGAVSLGVVIVVAGMVNLVVGHLLKGGCTVDDMEGNAVIGVGVG
jgi:hypothetical protein